MKSENVYRLAGEKAEGSIPLSKGLVEQSHQHDDHRCLV